FGQASTCLLVNLSNTAVQAITVSIAGSGASVLTTPALPAGANVTLVAFGATAGDVQFALLSNRFIPALNGAGLRFFNGGSSAGPVAMRRNDSTLTSLIRFGSASGFVSVPTDSARITFSNETSLVFDAGLMAFPQGENSTVLLGPPASGTNPLRSFTVHGC